MKRIATILAWILTAFLTFVFFFSGGPKLAGSRPMVHLFAQIGFGQWFRYVTGVLEISGAIGLWVPRFRFFAALLLASVMAGATLTNIVIVRSPSDTLATAILLALALALAWLRRPGRMTPRREHGKLPAARGLR